MPLFLPQVSETLRLETTDTPFPTSAIGLSATAHGKKLIEGGYSAAQVVQDYGEICQAITELAIELDAPISLHEFRTLNRCLDNAIAEAVTEHCRVRTQRHPSVQRSHAVLDESAPPRSTADT